MLISEIFLYEMAVGLSAQLTGLPTTIWASRKDAAAGGVQITHGARIKVWYEHNYIPVSISGVLKVEDGCILPDSLHNQVKSFIRLNMRELWKHWEGIIDDNQLRSRIRRLPKIGWEDIEAHKEKLRQDHQKYLDKISRR